MSDHSTIEWTDATWSPVTGCTMVSAGCTNCYAMRLAGTRLRHHWSRKGLTRETAHGSVWTGKVRLNKEWLDQPMGWTRPRRVFVCAHSDLFHEDVPDDFIDQVFAVMALCPQHTFQVLTKRPQRMLAYFVGKKPGDEEHELQQRAYAVSLSYWLEQYRPRLQRIINRAHGYGDDDDDCDGIEGEQTLLPLPNVWLGVSVEDQATANERSALLLATPATVRFVSYEPALGPVDLRYAAFNGADSLQSLEGLQWVIAGGESGPGARPSHPDWFRDVRDQCQAARVPFFFKQWGEWSPITGGGVTAMERLGKKRAGRVLDGRTWDEYPPQVQA